MKLDRNKTIQILILIIMYVLIGNSRSIQPNPIIPGAVLALNMIVPVIGGILFGRMVGLMSGIFGTLLNVISPVGSLFELAAIVPHGIMGFSAGYIKERAPSFLASLSLIIGHILNIIMFIVFGLLDYTSIISSRFWFGLGYEIFLGILAVIVIVAIYNLGLSNVRKNGTKQ